MIRLTLLEMAGAGDGAGLILLIGSENDSPWNETDRLRQEVQSTLDAAAAAAASLRLESGRGVVGRGVRSTDCERLEGGVAAEGGGVREASGEGNLFEEEEEEEEEWERDMYLEEICLELLGFGGATPLSFSEGRRGGLVVFGLGLDGVLDEFVTEMAATMI